MRPAAHDCARLEPVLDGEHVRGPQCLACAHAGWCGCFWLQRQGVWHMRVRMGSSSQSLHGVRNVWVSLQSCCMGHHPCAAAYCLHILSVPNTHVFVLLASALGCAPAAAGGATAKRAAATVVTPNCQQESGHTASLQKRAHAYTPTHALPPPAAPSRRRGLRRRAGSCSGPGPRWRPASARAPPGCCTRSAARPAGLR